MEVGGIYQVPSFDDYIPTRTSYEFKGWYLDSNLTHPAVEHAFLTEDIVLYAKWNAIQTLTGTITFSGTYIQNGEIINVWPADRPNKVTVILQEIASDGIYNIQSSLPLNITWNEQTKLGISEQYRFEGLDESKQYRIDIFIENYDNTYQNEETTISSDNNIANDYNEDDYRAIFKRNRTHTFVNAYLIFNGESYWQPIEVDSKHIGQDFRPTGTFVDVLYKLNGADDETFNVISQHTIYPYGIIINMDKTTGTSPNNDGVDVWKSLYDGKRYVYMARLINATINGNTNAYGNDAPYYVTQTMARWDSSTLHPTGVLLLTLIPKNYNIIFDLNTTDNVTGMDAYLGSEGSYSQLHTWSFDTLISASPQRVGYDFIGWAVEKDGVYVDGTILASVSEDVTLVAQWKKKENLSYVVNYLEKDTNVVLHTQKVVNNQTYGEEVTEEYADIEGYNVDGEEEQTIIIDEDNNIINFYYVKKNLKYQVEYYYDDVKNDNKTEVLTAPYLSEITTYHDKTEAGYTLDYVTGLPLTVDVDEDKNVIKVYYAKDVVRDGDITDDEDDVDDEGSDDVPDKYQKKITFKIINGSWSNDSSEDMVYYVTLMKDGKYDLDGTATIVVPTDMIPFEGYEIGSWDVTPSEIVSGTEDETYVYTFKKVPMEVQIPTIGENIDIENPSTGDNIDLWYYMLFISIVSIFGIILFNKNKVC